MFNWQCDFNAGEFICKQVDLVDEDREALRADVFRFAFEGQVQERNLLIGEITVQAYRIGHGILQTGEWAKCTIMKTPRKRLEFQGVLGTCVTLHAYGISNVFPFDCRPSR